MIISDERVVTGEDVNEPLEIQSSPMSGATQIADSIILYDKGVLIGIAPVIDGTWSLTLPALDTGGHVFTASADQVQSNAWALWVADLPYYEYTHFNDSSWDGWQPGPVGGRVVIVRPPFSASGNLALFNNTFDNSSAGVVIRKTLYGLRVGRRYRFELLAGQIVTRDYVKARLSLSTSAGNVTDVFIPPHNMFGSYGGEFVANATSVELMVVSHEASGIGNDYYLDDIRITGL